jgi:hypothetical protein
MTGQTENRGYANLFSDKLRVSDERQVMTNANFSRAAGFISGMLSKRVSLRYNLVSGEGQKGLLNTEV